MEFVYCPECGKKLALRVCGDEGEVPFCESCGRPFFAFSYPCVICLCVDEICSEVVMIKQGYVSEQYVTVAGYIKRGETAEEAAVREVKEETGLDVTSCTYMGSYYHGKGDNLMLGFLCRVKKAELALSSEVDSGGWFPLEKAGELLKKDGIARKILEKYLSKDQ